MQKFPQFLSLIRMKKFLSILLLLCLSLSLTACPASEEPPAESDAYVLTSPSPDTYHCAENGVTYVRHPAVYLPMSLSREPFATYKNEYGALLSFFALSEGSEGDYLMHADADDLYPYYVIASEDYHMPSLTEMNPYQIMICSAEEEMFWLGPNVYDQVRTIEKVRKVVTAYEGGETATLPVLATETVRVELIFVSAVYPDLAYTCTYYEYDDGSCYFHESATGRCVRVESGLFKGFVLTPEDR